MLFNSYFFILFFLPLSLILYYGLNHFGRKKTAELVLLMLSLWFYAYFHISYLLIILLSIVFNFGISKLVPNHHFSQKMRKAILASGILANIGVIFYFKYLNFFLENINYLFGAAIPLESILMPLGISFFTFQQIGYLVDSYRGETKEYALLEYALFVTFFPQLIAGPIVAHSEMIPQFLDESRKKLDAAVFAEAMYRFSVGLFKKVIIADSLDRGVLWGFSNTTLLSSIDTVTISLLYMLQLYFDFSGYCDMACGIAGMFHLELPMNFNSPYKAVSIQDFWKRWHISLTRFFRKYIYFPLGGSKKGKLLGYFNMLLVFFVSGVWHGANWTFILWGLIHGIAMILNKAFESLWNKIPKCVRWLMTFIFIDFTFLLFRCESLPQCRLLFMNIFSGKAGGIHPELLNRFNLIEFTYIEEHISVIGNFAEKFTGLNMWLVLIPALAVALFGKNCYEKRFQPSVAKGIGSIIMLTWSIISLSGLSTFLYFNF